MCTFLSTTFWPISVSHVHHAISNSSINVPIGRLVPSQKGCHVPYHENFKDMSTFQCFLGSSYGTNSSPARFAGWLEHLFSSRFWPAKACGFHTKNQQ